VSDLPPEKAILEMSRVIAAPRDLVFAAWTTPKDIRGWFGPEDCEVIDAQIDLRVGGEYCFQFSTPRLGEISVRGRYREVTPPAKLIYTWQWDGHPELTPQPSLVSVEFIQSGSFTEIHLRHEELPSIESRENHKRGWNGAMDKLAKYLGSNGIDFLQSESEDRKT
jgi:uncharacterized protein YndB with AHSA1/START domain